MKTIILFSLAFIFAVNSAPAPAPVLDLFGKYIRAGAEYTVTSAALDGKNGGLVPVLFNNKRCPAGVAQLGLGEVSLALTFTPVNPKKGVIRLSTDVNIKFSGSTGCNESNVWKLEYDQAMKEYAVMVGGVEGNPGPETLDNWFKLEKSSDDGYKFVFCPSVCSYCKVMCRDVGIVEDENGAKRLALSDDPLSLVFFPVS